MEYRQIDLPIGFWRTQTGHEVDFVLGNEIAIEVKSTSFATERHLDGLLELSQEMPLKRKLLISQDPEQRRIGDVEILPYSVFTQLLWTNQLML